MLLAVEVLKRRGWERMALGAVLVHALQKSAERLDGRPAVSAAEPLEGMTDEEVLMRATKAFARASELRPGSIQRAIQWGLFDSAMAEMNRRLMQHIERKEQ